MLAKTPYYKQAEAEIALDEHCAYCGSEHEDNYAIHRDGFGDGPEVPLCDACGSTEYPTCGQIWRRIANRIELRAAYLERMDAS